MLGIFKRQRPVIDLADTQRFAHLLLSDQFTIHGRAAAEEFEAEIAKIATFLSEGYTRIADAHARELRLVNPAAPFAKSETRDANRARDLATTILLSQADAAWGRNRVDSALIRLRRSRIECTA